MLETHDYLVPDYYPYFACKMGKCRAACCEGWPISFTLEDYMEQFDQLKKMGSLEQLMGLIPGMKPGAMKDAQIDERAIARTEAIIKSMTPAERRNPDILNGSRKKRIAAGSGTSVEQVNRLLKQFDQTKKMMKQLASGKMGKRGMPFPMG